MDVTPQSTPDAPLTRRQLRELERRGQRPVATDVAPAVAAPAVVPSADGAVAAPAFLSVSTGTSSLPVLLPSDPEPPTGGQRGSTDDETPKGESNRSMPSRAVPGQPTESSQPVAEQRRAAGRRAATPSTRTPSAHAPGRRRRSAGGVFRKVYSATALLFVGALVVGTTLPANAFRSESFVAEANTKLQPAAQVLQVDDESSAAAAAATSGRDDYSVTTLAQVLRQKYGTRNYSYSTTGSGPVRWPFPYTAPVSSGYGERAAPCHGCSSDHKGLDLTPGLGTPIFAIADGIVTVQAESGGFGNHVYIEHSINGQKIESRYAHMQWGSSPLRAGDTIAVGDFIGLVGSTGASTGPHLHLEILVNGSHVDPFVWLTANAG